MNSRLLIYVQHTKLPFQIFSASTILILIIQYFKAPGISQLKINSDSNFLRNTKISATYRIYSREYFQFLAPMILYFRASVISQLKINSRINFLRNTEISATYRNYPAEYFQFLTSTFPPFKFPSRHNQT